MNARVVNLESQLGPTRKGQLGEELAVAGIVVAKATALGSRVSHCYVSVKTKAVLATFDGTDPASAGAGIYLPVTSAPMVWSRRTVECARFIEAVNGQAGVVRFEPLSE
ncbi:MAG: hypothetical protein WC130_04450 [Kiritimatiellia bacterium]